MMCAMVVNIDNGPYPNIWLTDNRPHSLLHCVPSITPSDCEHSEKSHILLVMDNLKIKNCNALLELKPSTA